jgi:hypothetical protein
MADGLKVSIEAIAHAMDGMAVTYGVIGCNIYARLLDAPGNRLRSIFTGGRQLPG